ncbi:uncharacterized protein LOC123312514 [Coccinella septempunctata]|uniref:uncharacterized protein LOC123312514 n=1 Tax=Coccinella septempunctata TaxID=41139 RepID=UPI001D092942|nr:uncharacterized protein LOC123312514 [Coccinella septempunctata]
MEGEITQVESEANPSDVKVLDVIPVELVDGESYQAFRTVENVQRTKYYKQTYRRAWEQMPDFAGWLTAVEDEPTRAFCIYCQKTLHAHRLSLLKHTCTIRHQKAAQLHQIRKIKPIKGSHNQDSNTTDENETCTQEDDEEMEEQSEVVEEEEDDEGVENYVYLVKEEDDGETEEIHLVQDTKATSSSQQIFPHISTQVTDAVRGCPVSGLAISLYKLIEGKWTYINEGYTNHEGRFSKFIEGSNFTSGRYKLHYDVDKYFESKKQSSLYPFIEIVFDCKNFNTNYHIPLILSPNGYTTFKGSL